MICALETGGKMTAEEAYAAIKVNWKKLDASRKIFLGTESLRLQNPDQTSFRQKATCQLITSTC